MSNNTDLLLSEGTCYFGAGQVADSGYIACGNANIDGPQACCYKGDYCLSSNTCFDSDTIVTYIAGCTDSLFRSSVCPQRFGYPDQQWVALARGNGADTENWSGCAHHPEKITLEKENCDYNASNVLIQNPNGKDSFDEIGLLPNATGDTIQFNPTAVPTALPSSGGGGLSTGAKAGIGVGVGIGGLLLVAGAAFLFFTMRRRRRTQPTDAEKRYDELDGSSAAQRHEAGGTEKSELPADQDEAAKKVNELSPENEIRELDNTNQYNGELSGAVQEKSARWWRFGR